MERNIVCLVAHPDDEFLFGFPVIKHARKIIACVDDKTHPKRQWCLRRGEALKEIGKLVGAETVCLRHDSGFVHKAHGDLIKFVEEVRTHIADAEVIFTHNGWGEYGHLDHILLHQIVRMSGKPMLTTDICTHADWYKVKPYVQGEAIKHCINDLGFHEECMRIYKSFGAMGWTYPPIKECDLVEVFQ